MTNDETVSGYKASDWKEYGEYEFGNDDGLTLHVEKVESQLLDTVYLFEFYIGNSKSFLFSSINIKFPLLEFELDAIIKGLTILKKQSPKKNEDK